MFAQSQWVIVTLGELCLIKMGYLPALIYTEESAILFLIPL
ncbi:hypothetical protein UF75_4787 [Desulfosporosinus sp. I2]|nr:hypothetical protein UF75_4787 [Desulfosporosinus sp. I2]